MATVLKDTLQGSRGESLSPGQRITSNNGEYALIFRPDGNLVVMHYDVLKWQSNTAGRGRRLFLLNGFWQIADTNGKTIWAASNPKPAVFLGGPPLSSPQAYFVMQDDGNAVVYLPGGGVAWNANTWEPHDSWLQNAAKSAGRAIGSAVHAVSSVSGAIADAVGSIPFIGPALHAIYDWTYGAPFALADSIASGTRIDKALSRHLESRVQDIRDIAPYAQAVIALVPGVGPGVSGAISAGLSLAQGKPLDQVAIDATLGMLPGGPLAKSVAEMGIAAAQGKPIADIAVAALPIPEPAKAGVKAALHVVSDVAAGKRVDQALLAEADKQLEALPPAARTAAKVGIALAQGKRLQEIAAQAVVSTGAVNALVAAGQKAIGSDAILKQASTLIAGGTRGYQLGAGIMSHAGVNYSAISALRKTLTGANQKAFDTAIAVHKARVATPKPDTRSIDQKFAQAQAEMSAASTSGNPAKIATASRTFALAADAYGKEQARLAAYYALKGMTGASAASKGALAGVLVKNPATKAGASAALVEAAHARSQASMGVWEKIKAFFGFHTATTVQSALARK